MPWFVICDTIRSKIQITKHIHVTGNWKLITAHTLKV